jgi:predicted transcriptional regulator of viral defense system
MSIISDNIKSLSSKEVSVISDLEFRKKYYFSRDDIEKHFSSRTKLNYYLHRLISKKRIIKLNRNKYYLVPIKAKTGNWTDDAFIIADEIFNGKDYYVGGWAAANYWKLTEQIPMKIEIYTNKRNGQKKILSVAFIFRKTTKKRIDNAVTKKINEHSFRILGKKESKEWLKSKNF